VGSFAPSTVLCADATDLAADFDDGADRHFIDAPRVDRLIEGEGS